MSLEDDPQFVTALGRGLSVLRCFSRSSPILGTSEIARMLKLPQPTVWRLCHTLAKLGYLRATDDNRLTPGLGCLNLGFEVLTQSGLPGLAAPYMRELSVRFQGAVSLGIRDGASVVYLQRYSSGPIVMANLAIGSRVPLVSSANGWAFLANLDSRERDSIVMELDEFQRQKFEHLRKPFNASLIDFTKKGFIQANGILHPDINAVAVPIVPHGPSKTVYLMSCGGAASVFKATMIKDVGQSLLNIASTLKSAAF